MYQFHNAFELGIDAVSQQAVRLSAANLHDRPRSSRAAANLI
jgi:hypothetical protein